VPKFERKFSKAFLWDEAKKNAQAHKAKTTGIVVIKKFVLAIPYYGCTGQHTP